MEKMGTENSSNFASAAFWRAREILHSKFSIQKYFLCRLFFFPTSTATHTNTTFAAAATTSIYSERATN